MTVKEPDEVNVTHPDHQNQQLIVAYFGQENARKIFIRDDKVFLLPAPGFV